MFINPTFKGHRAPDTELVIPNAVLPPIVNLTAEEEIEPEPVNPLDSKDPFIRAFEEVEELYYDEFLDFYCGQHVHDT